MKRGTPGPPKAATGDGPIADFVANAPGGPVHVLLSDTVAEHTALVQPLRGRIPSGPTPWPAVVHQVPAKDGLSLRLPAEGPT